MIFYICCINKKKTYIYIYIHTMGSYDGAETCELAGSFLLSQLQELNINIGLYKDDGLVISNTTPRDTENFKKEICRIFNPNGLRITIEANKHTINFLDVTFNPNKNNYQPFARGALGFSVLRFWLFFRWVFRFWFIAVCGFSVF